jgi:hypothetical protein
MLRKCKYCKKTFRTTADSRRTRCTRDECVKAQHRAIKKRFRKEHPDVWRKRSREAMQKLRARRKLAKGLADLVQGNVAKRVLKRITNVKRVIPIKSGRAIAMLAGSVEQQQHVHDSRAEAYAERERARKRAYYERCKLRDSWQTVNA